MKELMKKKWEVERSTTINEKTSRLEKKKKNEK